MVLVTTADGSTNIKGMSYDALKGGQSRKAARELKKTLAEVNVLGEAPKAAEDDTPVAAEDSKVEEWTNTDGKTIKAAVKSLDDTRVQFEMENGKSVWYPIDKLSSESQERLLNKQ